MITLVIEELSRSFRIDIKLLVPALKLKLHMAWMNPTCNDRLSGYKN